MIFITGIGKKMSIISFYKNKDEPLQAIYENK